jgi:pimeloyl-ACP methyl ester carboxylesterase
MPHVQANGIRLYYESTGEGTPLVLIPGFAQNLSCWRPLVPALAANFPVIAIDNRGSGQSDAPEERYSIEMFAQDSAALLEALEIESAHFMGVSMGTLIIQQLCLTHPEKVKKAILCAPFSHLPSIARHNVLMQQKLLAAGVPRADLFELNMSWLLSEEWMSSKEKKDAFLSTVLADPYPAPIEGILGQADALLAADYREQLANIPHEILLLAAREDIDTPIWCAKEMEKTLPYAKLHIFEKVAHLFPYEIPEKTVEKSLNFLS